MYSNRHVFLLCYLYLFFWFPRRWVGIILTCNSIYCDDVWWVILYWQLFLLAPALEIFSLYNSPCPSLCPSAAPCAPSCGNAAAGLSLCSDTVACSVYEMTFFFFISLVQVRYGNSFLFRNIYGYWRGTLFVAHRF